MHDPLAIKPPFKPSPLEPCVCGSDRSFAHCCGQLAQERSPPVGVHIVEQFIDAATCRQWISHLEKQPRGPLAVHNRSASHLVTRMSEGRVTDKVQQGALANEIHQMVNRAFAQTIPGITGHQMEWFEKPQVLRYTRGGQYGRHADADHFVPEHRGWVRSIDRDYSLLVYLNEDFDGGELGFFRYNYFYRPRQGDLLFFPSDNRFVHQARVVRSGIRYAVVSWGARVGGPRTGEPPPPEITRLA